MNLQIELSSIKYPHPPFFIVAPKETSEVLLDSVRQKLQREIIELDARKMTTIASLLNEFSYKLQFPDYFGHNLDAFIDVMHDSTYFKRNEFTIVIHNGEQLLKLPRSFRYDLFVMLRDIAVGWAIPNEGNGEWDHPSVPFKIILECNNPKKWRKLQSLFKRVDGYWWSAN